MTFATQRLNDDPDTRGIVPEVWDWDATDPASAAMRRFFNANPVDGAWNPVADNAIVNPVPACSFMKYLLYESGPPEVYVDQRCY